MRTAYIFKEKIKIILNLIYPLKAKSFRICKNLLLNKAGLEIGGPSEIFSKGGLLPLYSYIKCLDNCNFSSETTWQGQLKEGYTFKYDENHSSGFQFILDTTDLNKIPSAKYDFLLSCHVIEHIANPIKALFEWIRVLKDGGILVLIVPHKDGTFDHNRSITHFNHILDDYKQGIKENDLTHLEEILELHDLGADKGVQSYSQFKDRSLNNFENRCLHHHVFNSVLAVKLLDFAKLQILSAEAVYPCHIILVAQKFQNHNNQELIKKFVNKEFKSPFRSDIF